jgi:hypothetical protein
VSPFFANGHNPFTDLCESHWSAGILPAWGAIFPENAGWKPALQLSSALLQKSHSGLYFTAPQTQGSSLLATLGLKDGIPLGLKTASDGARVCDPQRFSLQPGVLRLTEPRSAFAVLR